MKINFKILASLGFLLLVLVSIFLVTPSVTSMVKCGDYKDYTSCELAGCTWKNNTGGGTPVGCYDKSISGGGIVLNPDGDLEFIQSEDFSYEADTYQVEIFQFRLVDFLELF